MSIVLAKNSIEKNKNQNNKLQGCVSNWQLIIGAVPLSPLYSHHLHLLSSLPHSSCLACLMCCCKAFRIYLKYLRQHIDRRQRPELRS